MHYFLDLRHLILLVIVPSLLATMVPGNIQAQKPSEPVFGIVIHGGAGHIRPARFKGKDAQAYEQALEAARDRGYQILATGGSATAAVEAAIMHMESDPRFNAGYGAVLTKAGRAECDASIMDGKTRQAGAVAGVGNVAHPIQLATMVMTTTEHILLMGAGAEAFAEDGAIGVIENDKLISAQRREQWQRSHASDTAQLDHNIDDNQPMKKHGTVGAVALDQNGNLAAGTSTGGMMNKMPGRTGDSPIIGAGTYADNATCAVSGTGHGEHFMRTLVAYDIAARMQYLKEDLRTAAQTVVMDSLVDIDAEGGVIAIDRHGHIALPFNTPGMFRAWRLSDARRGVRLFDNAFYEDDK